MTTATKTRPRRTKKKAVAKKRRATNGRKGSTKAKTAKTKKKTKKPKWTLVTFKQLEEWRQKLGLSKSGMAEALQVTNSTYHNWRRGTTVPHPNQQQDILQRIEALETNVAAGGKPTASNGKPPRGKRSGGKPTPRNRLNAALDEGGGDDSDDGANGAGGANGSRPFALGIPTPGTTLVSAKVPRDDIASITVAYIQSQKKEVSAGSVIKFVRDLNEVL